MVPITLSTVLGTLCWSLPSVWSSTGGQRLADRGFSGLSAMQILLEGEKETGSANLPGLLDQKKALLSADLAVSCDGGQISESQGGIPISLRGRISFDLTAQTLSQDVHSGKGPASALEPTWM